MKGRRQIRVIIINQCKWCGSFCGEDRSSEDEKWLGSGYILKDNGNNYRIRNKRLKKKKEIKNKRAQDFFPPCPERYS